jgi:NTE family protein
MMSRIWRFPANYKAFYKIGRAAQIYTKMAQRIPRMKFASESRNRFYNDWMDLMLTMGCPTTLGLWSKGTCQPAPFIDKMVDFDKLKDFPSDFYMNAYCLESRDIEIFSKQQINVEHFQAALSMPYIYAPYKLNGKTYIEGSAVDTICFEPVMKDLYEPVPDCDWTPSPSGKKVPVAYRPKHDKPKIDSLILFNMLGHAKLLREPDNLLDALGMQIITPLVPMTQDDIRIFKNEYLPRYQVGNPKLRLLSVDVHATEEEWQHMLDWSYSNGERLFKMGYDAAVKFFEQHKERLLSA